MNRRLRSIPTLVLAASLLPAAGTGCASMSSTQKGAVIGAGAGAAAGAVIGKATGSTARGAILGAAVGGAAGAIIGHQMDKQGDELAADLPNAKVERVGEGLLVTFNSGLLFDFDSDVVKGAARTNLTELAQSLEKYPKTDVLIVGHTDNVGNATYNEGLSMRRAQSARSFLVSRGLSRDRVNIDGRGETEPVAGNETEAGRQQNRRVEVAIFASEAYRQEIEKKGGVPAVQ